MTNTQNLVRHRDIQNWVSARQGRPALMRIPDATGHIRARLALNFARGGQPQTMPSIDDGISPCSWSAWLAELDRQQLALQVGDKNSTEFTFVPRREMN